MRFEENPIWDQLKNYQFDSPDPTETFSERLARKGGWTKEFTREVIEEYRKFLFLIATEKCILIPSPSVDLAWCIHTEHYYFHWNKLRLEILKCDVQRFVPDSEDNNTSWNAKQYQRTLQLYSWHFQTYPLAVLWPTSDEWFNPRLKLWFKINGKTATLQFNYVMVTGFILLFFFQLGYPSMPAFVFTFVTLIITFFIYRFCGTVRNYTWSGPGYTKYK